MAPSSSDHPRPTPGKRTIAFPPHLAADLAEHLGRYVGPDDTDPVFTGEKGGPLRPHVLQKAWVKAKQATGAERLHLHDLRHAGNTRAAATGASTKELMARMGHANAAAALRYQHGTTSRGQAIAAALSQLAERTQTPAIIPEAAEGPSRTTARVAGPASHAAARGVRSSALRPAGLPRPQQ